MPCSNIVMFVPSFLYYSCFSTTFLTSRPVMAIVQGRRGLYHTRFFCSSPWCDGKTPTVGRRSKFVGWSSTSRNSVRRYKSNDPTLMENTTNTFPTGVSEQVVPLLPFKEERHKSIHVHMTDDIGWIDTTHFISQLTATVEAAKAMGKSSVWIHVPMHRASLIEAISTSTTSYPFQFHHAQGTIASLYLWLPQNISCTIPPFATHHVGVGALVVNSQKEVLVVQEAGTNYVPWKIPGGLSNLGENIEEAAIREVKEETGIDCQFHNVLAARHTHNIQFGRSDLYFICRLSPISTTTNTSSDSQQPQPQPGEIHDAKWLPWDQYKDMIEKYNHPMMKLIVKLYEQGQAHNNVYDIQTSWVESIVPGRSPSPVYHTPILRSTEVNQRKPYDG